MNVQRPSAAVQDSPIGVRARRDRYVGHSPVPNCIHQDERLRSVDVHVVAVLLYYARGNLSRCWPSNSTIAAKVRVNVSTIKESLNRLEAAGHIRRDVVSKKLNGTGRIIVLLWRVDDDEPSDLPPSHFPDRSRRQAQEAPHVGRKTRHSQAQEAPHVGRKTRHESDFIPDSSSFHTGDQTPPAPPPLSRKASERAREADDAVSPAAADPNAAADPDVASPPGSRPRGKGEDSLSHPERDEDPDEIPSGEVPPSRPAPLDATPPDPPGDDEGESSSSGPSLGADPPEAEVEDDEADDPPATPGGRAVPVRDAVAAEPLTADQVAEIEAKIRECEANDRAGAAAYFRDLLIKRRPGAIASRDAPPLLPGIPDPSLGLPPPLTGGDSDTVDTLNRLAPGCHKSFLNRAVSALCRAFGPTDRRDYQPAYQQVVEDVCKGLLAREGLVYAYQRAMGRGMVNRGAAFCAALRKWEKKTPGACLSPGLLAVFKSLSERAEPPPLSSSSGRAS